MTYFMWLKRLHTGASPRNFDWGGRWAGGPRPVSGGPGLTVGGPPKLKPLKSVYLGFRPEYCYARLWRNVFIFRTCTNFSLRGNIVVAKCLAGHRLGRTPPPLDPPLTDSDWRPRGEGVWTAIWRKCIVYKTILMIRVERKWKRDKSFLNIILTCARHNQIPTYRGERIVKIGSREHKRYQAFIHACLGVLWRFSLHREYLVLWFRAALVLQKIQYGLSLGGAPQNTCQR